MFPEFLTTIGVVLLGLLIGSHLNVLISRLPRNLSTVKPRSRCPYCRVPIRPVDNIPVLSYFVLKGRCRCCRAPIAARYPLIELLTAILFLAVTQHFGLGATTLVAALFGCLMLVLAAIDLEHYLLPDKITFPGLLLGLVLQPWIPDTSWLDAGLGALIGAGILILLINGWYWLRGVEGMGLGDVNMLALIGAYLGWQGVLITLSIASVSGSLVGLPLLFAGRLGFQSKLPFGLFLALGALVTLFAKAPIIAWYSRLFY